MHLLSERKSVAHNRTQRTALLPYPSLKVVEATIPEGGARECVNG